ncbi:MAG: hypothetical protein MRQ11_02105 [Candidatus Midichloria mitochondrii]|nr:hypothetical protein [Candidatus Midichloria mitochondrii]
MEQIENSGIEMIVETLKNSQITNPVVKFSKPKSEKEQTIFRGLEGSKTIEFAVDAGCTKYKREIV